MAETILYSEKCSENAEISLFGKMGYAGSYDIRTAVTIGRKSSQNLCDIGIDSPIVSRRHGEIAQTEGEFFYRDLNTTNGTYINGVLFGSASKLNQLSSPLANGDVICIDICKEGNHHSERVIALFTTVGLNETKWKSIPLSDEIAEICIGRSDKSAVQISDQTISEKHTSFFCSSNGWAIIDHKSKNGVYLNGKRISSPRYLSNYDVIRIADAFFVFCDNKLFYSEGIQKLKKQNICHNEQPCSTDIYLDKEQPAQAPSVSKLESKNLVINILERSVVQRFKKMLLLQDINITVSNGDMVLILGGSGAGKTTFINAVMGYEKAEGKIVYNDTDIYDEYEQMKYEIGFVPQQDLLRNSDTVYDTLSNAAEMKLPRSVSYEEREQRIITVLDELGLTREKDSLISKLSGGQRKRLSIAVEFISDPSLFFLDEPDSGIDDIMGRGLMENLRSIADNGKIVMIITHSPERAADLFDKVIVLAKSTKDNCGHLAFYGTVKDAFDFFSVSSFPEIVKKINRPDENGEGLSDYYIDKYKTEL